MTIQQMISRVTAIQNLTSPDAEVYITLNDTTTRLTQIASVCGSNAVNLCLITESKDQPVKPPHVNEAAAEKTAEERMAAVERSIEAIKTWKLDADRCITLHDREIDVIKDTVDDLKLQVDDLPTNDDIRDIMDTHTENDVSVIVRDIVEDVVRKAQIVVSVP